MQRRQRDRAPFLHYVYMSPVGVGMGVIERMWTAGMCWEGGRGVANQPIIMQGHTIFFIPCAEPTRSIRNHNSHYFSFSVHWAGHPEAQLHRARVLDKQGHMHN